MFCPHNGSALLKRLFLSEVPKAPSFMSCLFVVNESFRFLRNYEVLFIFASFFFRWDGNPQGRFAFQGLLRV